MSLEQMRDAPEVEVSSYEQSILNKRTGRKRKAPQDDEVSHKNNKKSSFFLKNEAVSILIEYRCKYCYYV